MKPEKQHQYNIFKTPWGWFGVLGCEDGLLRTCLPVARKEAVVLRMLSDMPNPKRSRKVFSVLQKRIQSYYKGDSVDFSDINVCLGGFSEFQQNVLVALRNVTYGNTVSYGTLARFCGNPNAARAIGSVMAANPLSLIIPCHRVIKSDGTLGQFSAPGGTKTKIRMLKLENP